MTAQGWIEQLLIMYPPPYIVRTPYGKLVDHMIQPDTCGDEAVHTVTADTLFILVY